MNVLKNNSSLIINRWFCMVDITSNNDDINENDDILNDNEGFIDDNDAAIYNNGDFIDDNDDIIDVNDTFVDSFICQKNPSLIVIQKIQYKYIMV